MLQQNKRLMQSANYVSKFESMFACPICHLPMKVRESKSIICSKHHTFDFTKQGYLNFMTRPVNTKYNKELFEARRKLIVEGGFFEPLSRKIAEIINDAQLGHTLSILDTGCGEGSHLSSICRSVNKDVVGVGIDISKEGIQSAAKSYNDKIWAVADLAKTPFKEASFDVILNMLSPSNYTEFHRLLKINGIVIKIVPQSGYLKELREQIFENRSYSNEDTTKRFHENFQSVERMRLTYNKTLDKSALEWLVQMTPMTWSKKEKITPFLKKEYAQITVDLDILIGLNNC
ncbi:putative RNA methyltransferase [Bacillus timonensis]|uniref:putative RNA methyltransferase n=1 Tax=Bacillus timonensis TaxID=1033734 RepID=UPI000287D46F|nr:methyltransferase domain-containing protein [Bacillus timonensis]